MQLPKTWSDVWRPICDSFALLFVVAFLFVLSLDMATPAGADGPRDHDHGRANHPEVCWQCQGLGYGVQLPVSSFSPMQSEPQLVPQLVPQIPPQFPPQVVTPPPLPIMTSTPIATPPPLPTVSQPVSTPLPTSTPTPTIQAPAVQAPAYQAPAVPTPAATDIDQDSLDQASYISPITDACSNSITDRESLTSGLYLAVNLSSGAYGRWQLMPHHGVYDEFLAAHAGMPRPSGGVWDSDSYTDPVSSLTAQEQDAVYMWAVTTPGIGHNPWAPLPASCYSLLPQLKRMLEF